MLHDEDSSGDEISDEEFWDDIPSDLMDKRRRELQSQIKHAAEKAAAVKYGTYDLVQTEKALMDLTTEIPRVVVHFAHKDFKRCRIMDGHLQTLAEQYPEIRFLKIFVENCNFLVAKLGVKVLPCLICFKDAVTFDKIIGFEGVSEDKDQFPTSALEWRLKASKFLPQPVPKVKFVNTEEEDEYA